MVCMDKIKYLIPIHFYYILSFEYYFYEYFIEVIVKVQSCVGKRVGLLIALDCLIH